MNTFKENLIQNISNKDSIVGIIGLGYVGIPLMLSYISKGFNVLGFDIDIEKNNILNSGKSYIEHIPSSQISNAVRQGFEAINDFSRSKECDILIICVPTPLNRHRDPDLSFVIDAVDAFLPFLRKGQVISLESTTWPGTTEEKLLPLFENAGFTVGENVFLIYSPEREDPGNLKFTTETIPKVIGGVTDNCKEVGIEVYRKIIKQVVPVSSARAAEMTKLLENIYRAVNIGLVNELKMVCDCMNIDIHEVVSAASTKPFGYTPYFPGPGLGGHCIPIDPFYLTWKAREYGLNTRFIELAGEVNTKMPKWVVEKTVKALNSFGKAVNGSNILILGIAYKKNVDDIRESPAVQIMKILQKDGAVLNYSDPHIPSFPVSKSNSFNLKSVNITKECLQEYDCVLIVTNHDKFDYPLIRKNSKLIIDSRGVYRDYSSNNIIKA